MLTRAARRLFRYPNTHNRGDAPGVDSVVGVHIAAGVDIPRIVAIAAVRGTQPDVLGQPTSRGTLQLAVSLHISLVPLADQSAGLYRHFSPVGHTLAF